jgi:hypothetical protein
MNRSKQAPLGDEGRQRLREAALQNQPWRFSTGPKTEGGKAIAAQNGRKKQMGQQSIRQIRASLFEVNEMLVQMQELRKSILDQ